MADAQVASPVPRSLHSASFVELRDSIPSHVELISPFVDQLMGFISRFRVSDETNSAIELALREALINAIVHGNQHNPQKRVYVKCRCAANDEVSITIDVEGHGLGNPVVPNPSSSDHWLGGSGMDLMAALMDEVEFERGGSAVHMRKRARLRSDSTRKPQ